MRNTFLLVIFLMGWFIVLNAAFAFGQMGKPFPSSSPNPVGSGARAIGMGGAFMGVADDATAASWNPGGLIQVERPEASFVVNSFHRIEDNTFRMETEANGKQTVSDEMEINYFSLTRPFIAFDRNMSVAVTYQHLYDFSREWDILIAQPYNAGHIKNATDEANFAYERSGRLSALGLSYCVEPFKTFSDFSIGLLSDFSIGVTVNLWNNFDRNCEWEENSYISGLVTKEDGQKYWSYNIKNKDRYSFKGYNANIGILWGTRNLLKIFNGEDILQIGAVLKLPFKAKLRHEGESYKKEEYYEPGNQTPCDPPKNSSDDKKLKMPMSYGIGISYRLQDNFTIALDCYRTDWHQYILIDSDGDKSPINDELSTSDIDPTYQIRFGGEYLLYNKNQRARYIFPIRAGMFYDPAPAKEKPDDFYGFSLGGGLITDKYSIDLALQYRWGNDVNSSMVDKYYNFSQDIKEFNAYLSIIYYFNQ